MKNLIVRVLKKRTRLDISISCFRSVRFNPKGRQVSLFCKLDGSLKFFLKLLYALNGMVGGHHDHDGVR
jgi:hypothetical protein